jgi:hypothetical protein
MDEKIEELLTLICEDYCRWPYVETDQEAMDERCTACPVMQRILTLAKEAANGKEV